MTKKSNQTADILSGQHPLVSIIVRSKNRNTLLQNALDSLAAQSYTNLQVVLVNDGGNDISQLIQPYTTKLRIDTIVHQQSVGRANALNDGISAADGEWIGILDDDDIYLPEAISSLVTFALNTTADVVYGKVEMLDYQDEKNPKHLRFFDTAYNKDRFIFDNFIPVNAILIKRDILETTGKIDSSFKIFEDWDFFYRISQITDFDFLNTMVAEYRSYGDATAIGGKTQELHSQYRTLFYEKHFKSFTPIMLTNFYNLVLQDNQKKYLSTIDQLLRLNQTFNERNDHSLAYTKEVNNSLLLRIEQTYDSLFIRLEQLLKLNHTFNERNDQNLNYTKQSYNSLLDKTEQLLELNHTFNERDDYSLTYSKQMNASLLAKLDQFEQQINLSLEQQLKLQNDFSKQFNELSHIKLQLSHTFSARLRRFVKRLFTH